ncbi:hypothetical protein E4U21_005812 [Claviceps maximensis]|nr:hypothetical protein E4U21_005812 [Claviceps maximensis]
MPKPQDRDSDGNSAHHADTRRDSHRERDSSTRHRDRHRHRHRHTPSRSRSRSRSPEPRHHHAGTTTRHHRSASPNGRSQRSNPDTHTHTHHRRHRNTSRERRQKKPTVAVVPLPFTARRISKADYEAFEPLFAHYLELQKQKDLGAMEEREVRGRWKSFAGKWNRGELAEGWYDPDTFMRCASEYEPFGSQGWDSQEDGAEEADRKGNATARMGRDGGGDDDDDDDYAPVLPGERPRVRMGAKSATRQELSLRDELVEEQRETQRDQLRQARRDERALEKERLEELAPRAEPGTRERKLEKKKEVNEKMRQFRDKSPGMEGASEAQLMGGGDGIDDYKREREKEKRRRSARQIRREEFERAKTEEMEHRRKLWKEREEGTVEMLRELAKQRFG